MTEFSSSFDQSILVRARNRLGQFAKRQEEQAEAALAIGAEVGAETLRRGLLAATTATGRRRARTQGGLPGRYESGAMYDAVKTDAATPFYDGERIVIAFGFFPDDYQAYFTEQENGTATIPAAHAFPPAIIAAREAAQAAFQRNGSRV